LDNYRPISILPVLSKVFERVVHRQLYAYLEENNLLSKNQFGFRTKSSTQHAVTKFSDSIRQNMDKGLMTGAIFIDLRKAFDTVDHARLLSKLTIYGIRNDELMWFEDYLFNRTQFVAFEGVESSVQPISCGVPQGSILGPLLFVLLVNDIDIHLKRCEIILYADDTVIYHADRTCERI
jgi:retron-type reverse transcriptase